MRKRVAGFLLPACAALALWEGGLRPLFVSPPRSHAGPREPARDNPELARLYEEDQADRSPAGGKAIDWKRVTERDKTREDRVKKLYTADGLRTEADCYHAAMVLQHADRPEDYLLAHELCVVAVGKGEKRARWLAAASEDRFLMAIGRPQRFATQFRKDGGDSRFRLHRVDP
jgi:hypothetical protein